MADNTADQVDFTADQVDLCLDEIVQDVVEDKASAAEVTPHPCEPVVLAISDVKTALLFRLLPPGPRQTPAQMNQRGVSQKTSLTSLLRPAQKGQFCSRNLHHQQAVLPRHLLCVSKRS